MAFLIYLFVFVIFVVCVVFLLRSIEQFINSFNRRAPTVSMGRKKADRVIKQITELSPNSKTILDIGSGWGYMVAAVANAYPKSYITGIEVMPMPFIVSRLRCVFIKNAKIIFGDAFKYLENSGQKFDVGIAYLLTPQMKDVEKFLSKFDVLLCVDFPLPNVKPTKKIKLHKDRFIQHWLYVYKS